MFVSSLTMVTSPAWWKLKVERDGGRPLLCAAAVTGGSRPAWAFSIMSLILARGKKEERWKVLGAGSGAVDAFMAAARRGLARVRWSTDAPVEKSSVLNQLEERRLITEADICPSTSFVFPGFGSQLVTELQAQQTSFCPSSVTL